MSSRGVRKVVEEIEAERERCASADVDAVLDSVAKILDRCAAKLDRTALLAEVVGRDLRTIANTADQSDDRVRLALSRVVLKRALVIADELGVDV